MEIVSTLRTTGAVRAFTDEPVDDDVIHEILDDARFAPSGGNRQPWRVAVVKDPTIRRRLGELMQPVWDGYVARAALGITPYNWVDDREPSTVAPAPNALLDGIATIPVVLVVAADLRQIALMDAGLERPPLAGGASVYPFCWSILLAARARGLGGVITTFLSRAEPAAAPTAGTAGAPRAGGDDLPRRPRAPAHQAAAAAGGGVHHRRPLRRRAVRSAPEIRGADESTARRSWADGLRRHPAGGPRHDRRALEAAHRRRRQRLRRPRRQGARRVHVAQPSGDRRAVPRAVGLVDDRDGRGRRPPRRG